MTTIAYLTSRENPRIEWFFDSLANQTREFDVSGINVLVVDFHAETPGRKARLEMDFNGAFYGRERPGFRHVTPKPTVWQGPHRLTQGNWFAPSNARNTALCLAPDGHIIYVDDLSVLMPGWFKAAQDAIERGGVTCGAYRKVLELTVEPGTGVVTHFVDCPNGHDTRTGADGPVGCGGRWLYGCSLVAPVDALLNVGGWPEALCDSLGSEDYILGFMLQNNGVPLTYDRRMMTWESEELHFVGEKMRREDFGVSPNDKSHKVLEIAQRMTSHPNYFGEEGIRGLRARVLAGEPFPVMKVPEHEWFRGTPLGDL